MTEAGWLAADEPDAMLEAVRASGNASDRKLRLFAVACCRRVWHLLKDERTRPAVETAERFADGEVDLAALTAASWQAAGVRGASGAADAAMGAACCAAEDLDTVFEAARWCLAAVRWAVELAPSEQAEEDDFWRRVAEEDSRRRAANEPGGPFVPLSQPTRDAAVSSELIRQADLVRDIFGPLPFRRVPVDEAWLRWNHATVPAVVRRIYNERSFHDLPILADALEDAGCTNEDILNHCRQPGVHVRGCWVVDLLLGKD